MKNLNVRLPEEMHARLVAAAQDNRRSLNSEVLWLLEQALKASEETGQ